MKWTKLTRTLAHIPMGFLPVYFMQTPNNLIFSLGWFIYELNEDRTPVETGFDRFIDRNAPFIGKDALLSTRHDSPLVQLIGFQLEGREAAHPGNTIFKGTESIGSVTSSCYAPSLDYAIGMGYIKKEYATPDVKFEIQVGSRMIAARCVRTPFYKKGTARKKIVLPS